MTKKKKTIKLTLPTNYKSKVIFSQLPYIANLKELIFQASLMEVLKNRENLQKKFISNRWFNPIKDEGRGRRAQLAPYHFFLSSVTSTNVGISHQNFLIFSFNPFATLVQNFKFVSSVSSKIIELKPTLPLKICGFSGQILINLRLW